jgi:hypothetical protein
MSYPGLALAYSLYDSLSFSITDYMVTVYSDECPDMSLSILCISYVCILHLVKKYLQIKIDLRNYEDHYKFQQIFRNGSMWLI